MRKISWITLGMIILPMISLCTHVPTARADDISNPSSSSCSGGGSWQFGICRTGQQDAAEVYANDHQPQQNPGQQQSSSNPSTVNDQRAQLTADAAASPEAHAYAEDDQCDGRTMHTVTLPDGTESAPFVCTHITRKGNGNNAGQAPTTREILHFEGNNGPDGIKRKSPSVDEPWHYIDPANPNDRALAGMINDHYVNLVQALRDANRVRAAFEAAWMAHAITDGLTPAHHYPLSDKIEELWGKPK